MYKERQGTSRGPLAEEYGPSHTKEHVPKAYRRALGTGAQSGGSLMHFQSLPSSRPRAASQDHRRGALVSGSSYHLQAPTPGAPHVLHT